MKFLTLWVCLHISSVCLAKDITISAAISLKDSFNELANSFHSIHPEYKINLNYASSGQLRQQIEAGAPVDIFASASMDQMKLLQNRKLLHPLSQTIIARNSLVLTAPKNSSMTENRFENLNKLKFKRIGIGHPKTVPAGKYAKEALKSISLWQNLKKKLILADHVRQVLNYVETKEVDLGIIYYTDYLQHADRLKKVSTISSSHHSAITYPMALISKSKNLDFYNKWQTHLKKESSVEILRKYGFR